MACRNTDLMVGIALRMNARGRIPGQFTLCLMTAFPPSSNHLRTLALTGSMTVPCEPNSTQYHHRISGGTVMTVETLRPRNDATLFANSSRNRVERTLNFILY